MRPGFTVVHIYSGRRWEGWDGRHWKRLYFSWFNFTFVWTHISVYERNGLCLIVITQSFPSWGVSEWGVGREAWGTENSREWWWWWYLSTIILYYLCTPTSGWFSIFFSVMTPWIYMVILPAWIYIVILPVAPLFHHHHPSSSSRELTSDIQ